MSITALFTTGKSGNIVPVLRVPQQPGCKLMVQLSGGWALEDEHLSIWNEHVEMNRMLENRNCCIFLALFKMKKEKHRKERHASRY